jgi:hypothetical protein
MVTCEHGTNVRQDRPKSTECVATVAEAMVKRRRFG